VRDAILLSANNKPYARTYRYRLAAQFEPPSRAYRIAQLLRARPRFDAAYFAQMQLDTFSLIDLEIARAVVRFARTHPQAASDASALRALEHWDGRYEPSSRAAALEHALRLAVFSDGSAFSMRLDALRSSRRSANIAQELDSMLSFVAFSPWPAWRKAGGMRIEHLLAPMSLDFLDGAWLPGSGDEYTIHLQEPAIAQSFRAVWDVGSWDRGGISIPSGESGEPGSGHYTDLTRDWVDGRLQPLPFSRAAVQQDATGVLVLRPVVR
jgi:penicillin amidase